MKTDDVRTSAWAALWLLITVSGFTAQVQSPPAQNEKASAVRVLVAYMSVTGNTERMAAGVVEGARKVSNVEVIIKKFDEVTKEDLVNSTGLVLGCPTHYGSIPGEMKMALDRWASELKVDFTDKIGGAFSTGGGQAAGKELVIISLLVFMLQNRMIVAGPLYEDEKGAWGEMGSAAMTGPLDSGVSQSELNAARKLGERVARVAIKFRTEGR